MPICEKLLNCITNWSVWNYYRSHIHLYRGGPERMGPRPSPWVPLLKSSGSSIHSTSLGSKTLNTSLGLGGTKIRDPVVGAPWPGFFTSPLGAFRHDAPALSPESAIPIMAKLGSSPLPALPVLQVLFWCNLFDVSSVFCLFFQANLIILIDPV